MENSKGEMPGRLEGFYNRLTKQNMKHRLYEIYKWQVGRKEASKRAYILWLKSLGDWFEQ